MTSQEARRLTHAQMTAWGTSGLSAQELRAVLQAVPINPVSGKPAVQFRELLKAKVKELPPPATR